MTFEHPSTRSSRSCAGQCATRCGSELNAALTSQKIAVSAEPAKAPVAAAGVMGCSSVAENSSNDARATYSNVLEQNYRYAGLFRGSPPLPFTRNKHNAGRASLIYKICICIFIYIYIYIYIYNILYTFI
jgi:hypothetical protein